jgi:hypothetical protein
VAITIATADRDARAAVILDKVNAGTGPALMQIRGGTRPTRPSDTSAEPILATIPLGEDPFPTPHSSGTTESAATPITVEAEESGTATWVRIYNADGVAVIDGAAGLTGSLADAILSTVNLAEGRDVTLELLTWTEPDGVV